MQTLNSKRKWQFACDNITQIGEMKDYIRNDKMPIWYERELFFDKFIM